MPESGLICSYNYNVSSNKLPYWSIQTFLVYTYRCVRTRSSMLCSMSDGMLAVVITFNITSTVDIWLNTYI